jgi:hypothetical protein
MLYPWESTLFGAEDAAQEFVNESTMIHFTCIEQGLKTYFGLNFGGFGDLKRYYSDPPLLLGTANVSGLVGSVHAQVVLAAQLASLTHRIFIWPDAVDVIQKRFYEETNETLLYHHPKHPGIRVVSYASAQNAGLKVVEGRYLSNQQRNSRKRSLESITVDVAQYALHSRISALQAAIAKLPTQVIILDFANFGPQSLDKTEEQSLHAQGIRYSSSALDRLEERWFKDVFEGTGVNEYVRSMSGKIQRCRTADWPDVCLRNCE